MRIAPYDVACRLILIAPAAPLLAQASWQQLSPAQSPQAAYQWSAAFDEAHGEGILRRPGQAWRWNGATWTQITGTVPNVGANGAMVYDVLRQRIVLWGTAPSGEQLWEWDGTAWLQLFVAMPPGRDSPAHAYDRARGVTVMFGGANNLDDTWEWNGTSWSHPLPAVRPPAREQAAMVFDPTTQRVLLYGGFGVDNVHRTDTWTWNGTTWQLMTPTLPPYARDRATMVADLHRKRVVLFGGSAYDFQTWEWDGAEWHSSNPGSPGAWQWMAGFYDSMRREAVFHGGTNPWVPTTNFTWRYRTPTPATVEPFGAGCAGSAGVPVLANTPYEFPWIGDTARNRVNVAAGELGALFVSSLGSLSPPTDLGPLGMPGCSLLVPADVLDFRTAQAGFAEWSVTIPNSASCVGLAIRQQAFPLDAGANALGLVASNGIVMTLGIR